MLVSIIEVLSIIRSDSSVHIYSTVSQDGADIIHFRTPAGEQAIPRSDLHTEYERIAALSPEDWPRVAANTLKPLDRAIARHLLGEIPPTPIPHDLMIMLETWAVVDSWAPKAARSKL